MQTQSTGHQARARYDWDGRDFISSRERSAVGNAILPSWRQQQTGLRWAPRTCRGTDSASTALTRRRWPPIPRCTRVSSARLSRQRARLRACASPGPASSKRTKRLWRRRRYPRCRGRHAYERSLRAGGAAGSEGSLGAWGGAWGAASLLSPSPSPSPR